MWRGNRAVYKLDGIRFQGERDHIPEDLDALGLIREILKKRCETQTFTKPVSVVKDVNGYQLEFTQIQTRSKLLHVKELEKGDMND